MHETALTKAHRDEGVELVAFKGAALPRAFAGLEAELDAARSAAAVTDLGWLAHVAATGRHRARFVHAMCTCQIKDLGPGEGRLGMFLTQKGRLVAQFAVDVEPDRLLLELGREDVDRAIAQVLKFRVADLVDLAPAEALSVLAVTGPGAAATLAAVGVDVTGLDRDFDWRDTATTEGIAVRVRSNPHRVGVAGFDVTVAPDAAPSVWRALRAVGAVPLGHDAWTALRVAGGYPVDGVDVDEQNVPLEAARLAAHVDWKKGCYIGQEVVCMMNDLGQPNRNLRGLVLPANADTLPAGADVFGAVGDEKAAGRVGTTARLPDRDAPVALAVLRRKFSAPGTTVYLADGREATVVDVPLSTAAPVTTA